MFSLSVLCVHVFVLIWIFVALSYRSFEFLWFSAMGFNLLGVPREVLGQCLVEGKVKSCTEIWFMSWQLERLLGTKNQQQQQQ